MLSVDIQGCASLLMSALFSLGGLPARPQNPHTWRTSLSLLVWLLTYVLSGLGGPTRNTNTNKTGSTISKEWTTPDSQNTPSSTNLEGEEIVGAPGNDGDASMPEQVKRPNPWRKRMISLRSCRLHTVNVTFGQGQCLRPTTSKDTTRIARAFQRHNRERHTSHA